MGTTLPGLPRIIPIAFILFTLICTAGAAAQPSVTPGAATVSAGAIISVTVSNGPGNRADFVLMVPAGSAPMHWSGIYQYLSGSTTRPATGMTSATLSFTAPASSGNYEFRLFENDTWTLLATSSVVTVTAAASPPTPVITINGGTDPVSVAAGSILTVGLTNGPGVRADFVLLVPAGSAAMHWSGNYQYLNGSTTRPSSGTTTATLSFTAPASIGDYEFRFYQNDTWTLLATSSVVTVTAAPPPPAPALTINGGTVPVTVAGGSVLTVGVTNGPGFRADYVLMVPAGSAATTWSGIYQYLSGSTTRPASGVTNATLTFVAPSSGGTFEFRLFENDTWTLRATSTVVTVTAATPMLSINGGTAPVTVAGGSQLTVQVTNGPGFRADFVMMVPAGSAPTFWSGVYQYLSGNTTRPASGMTSATLTFAAPTSGGTFEFRLFENDTWTLRANSSVVTVTPMPTLTTVVHATGVNTAIALVQDPSDPSVQYVALHGGRIRVIQSGVLQATDFLDLSAQIANVGEAGLLGLAFPPDYATSRRFYVKFSNLDGHTVVARFQRSVAMPLVADPATQLNLRWSDGLRSIPQPSSAHKGGNMYFGPDGYLYITVGDGSSPNSAQLPSSFLGKMLRIDVDVADANPDGHVVPGDNPFVSTPSTLPEIWSFGFRNPWQFSFDDGPGGTNALFIADVGQVSWEEVNFEPPGRGGRNYGWIHREGMHATPGVDQPPTPGAPTPFTDPALEYDHTVGHSVTGGFVYRGTALGSAFTGRYFFADFTDRRLWSAAVSVGSGGEIIASSVIEHTAELGGPAGVGFNSAFGRDADGELYLVDYINGTIRKLVLSP